ncbi:MAG: tetratricopeptide repeat protein, partial [Candidatus Thiodiazotropha sp.]
MPKFSVLTWVVIIVAQVTYGLLVYAMTRSYYEGAGVAVSHTPAVVPEETAHPQVGSFGSTLQPRMNIQPSAEALATEDPALIARLADDYFRQKEYPQAIELYERALKIDPDDVESYNDLGLSLFYIGQSQRAVNVLQTGVAKQPSFQRIQLTLGFVQAQTGNKQAASTAFKKAIALDSENSVGQEAK